MVSQVNVFSVPEMALNFSSICAIVIDSTLLSPFAEIIVWLVKIGTPNRLNLSSWTL
ncbi:hypothetical protein ES703_121155 [subsurface metagenome]